MYNFYSINNSNNNYGSWFNSMMGNQSATGSAAGISTSILSDRSLIKSGAYKKLMKAYYGQDGVAVKDDFKLQSDSTKKEKSTLTKTKANADALKNAADKLTQTGSKSVFQREMIENTEDGTSRMDYNKDKIYSAVKDFVDSYNTVVKNTIDSDTVSVLRKALNMTQKTKQNEKLLERVGITIGSDNQLSIDETKFKNASVDEIKSLFNGSTSFAGQIGSAAGDLKSTSANTISGLDSKFYNASGSYAGYNSSLNSMYNDKL